MALVPGVPAVELDSQIIFFVFLPPILFAAAYFTSWREFKRHIRAISFLACGLVVFTVCGMAVVIKWLVPELTWPMAFLFGAIISPPDASAAATVTHKSGFPRRLHTILEGESLINDATALVCYRFALAALVTQEFHFGQSVGQFFLVGVGGAVVGLAVAYAMLRMLTWVGDRAGGSAADAGDGVCLLLRGGVAALVGRDRDGGRRAVCRAGVAAVGVAGDAGRREGAVERGAAGGECAGVYVDRAAAADGAQGDRRFAVRSSCACGRWC